MLNVKLKDIDLIKNRSQLYQLIAGLSAITLILLGCLVILLPFFPAMLLSTILTLSTWPAFEWLRDRLKHRTALAAGLMTAALAACFIAPLLIIGTSIVDNYSKIYDGIVGFLRSDTAATAASLEKVRYVGPYLAKAWEMGMSDKAHMMKVLQEYAKPTSQMLLNLGSTIGYGLLDITLGVAISYFFFRHGMHVAVRIRKLIDRFGGEYGQHLLEVTKNTLIGVVYGILGTALFQGLLATIGFWISHIPGATFLGLMTFFVSLIPMGPPLIWGPAALWLFSDGHTYLALFLLCWGTLVISSVDTFLKPYFISLGSDMPLLLVLLGIMGGALAFGFIGIFIGPTLLALAYAMIIEWTSSRGKIDFNMTAAEKAIAAEDAEEDAGDAQDDEKDADEKDTADGE
ncbi:MAG: AI-2E family transporter [Alphaproteobacteria bacterium]|nr:AI-2E family transporter [Alphaproteobacteria bacterium]